MKKNVFSHWFKWFLFVIFYSGLISSTCFADDARFTATLNKNKVAVGEVFQVAFSATGNGSDFQAPSFQGLQVAGGPNQSTSISMVNGSISQSLTISYYLIAKQEGRVTIGAASIVMGGKRYSTKPLTVEVVKGSGNRPSNPQAGGGFQSGDEYPQEIGDNLFVKAIASKSSVYQGEALTVTYKVYSRLSLVSYTITKNPSLNGFWSGDLTDKNQQVSMREEEQNGILFQVAELKRMLVIPQKSGKLTIDPIEMDLVVRTQKRSNNFFDQFFGRGYQDIQASAKSQPVTVQVLPLPEQGKPADFSGAVGKFSFESTITRDHLNTGEGTNLKMVVKGNGNLNLIELPEPALSPDLEGYDPELREQISVSSAGVSGSREADYLLIPRQAGDIQIPEVRFSYFDPSAKQYVVLAGGPYSLQVGKGSGGAVNQAGNGNSTPAPVTELQRDVRFLHANAAVSSTLLFGSPTYWILFLILLVGAFGLPYGFALWNKRSGSLLVKQDRARKAAQSRLRNAEALNKPEYFVQFFEAVSGALNTYLVDGFGLQRSELSHDQIASALENRGVQPQKVEEFLSVLSVCEAARFSPLRDPDSMSGVYHNALELLVHLDQFKTA